MRILLFLLGLFVSQIFCDASLNLREVNKHSLKDIQNELSSRDLEALKEANLKYIEERELIYLTHLEGRLLCSQEMTTAEQTTGELDVTTSESTTEEQTTEEFTTEEMEVTTEQQTTEEFTTDESTTEEQTTEESTTEEVEVTTEQQTTEEQTTAQRTTEEQTTSERTTEEQTTSMEEFTTEELEETTEEQTTAERTTQEQTTNERTTEEQTTSMEEFTTEEQTTAESTTDEVRVTTSQEEEEEDDEDCEGPDCEEDDEKDDLFTKSIRHIKTLDTRSFSPCSDIVTQGQERDSQHAIFYDAPRNRYLMVFVRKSSNGSMTIVKTFLDASGNIMDKEENIEPPTNVPKRKPKITYNSVRQEFLIVYESGELGQEDVYACRVDAMTGSFLSIPYSVAMFSGSQVNVDVAYSPASDFYIVTYQDFDGNTLSLSLLGLQILESNGIPRGEPFRHIGNNNIREPVISYSPTSNSFLLAYSEVAADGTSDIVTHVIQSDGQFQTSGTRLPNHGVGKSNERLPELIHVIDTDQFIMSWQVETVDQVLIGVVQVSPSNVYGSPVVFGPAMYNRNPKVAYSPNNNGVVVVFQISNATFGFSDLISVSLHAHSLSFTSDFIYVNEPLPSISFTSQTIHYNSVQHQFLVLWNRVSVVSIMTTASDAPNSEETGYGSSSAAVGVLIFFCVLVVTAVIILVVIILLQRRHRRLHGPSFSRFNETEMEQK